MFLCNSYKNTKSDLQQHTAMVIGYPSQISSRTLALDGYEYFVEADIQDYREELWNASNKFRVKDIPACFYLLSKYVLKKAVTLLPKAKVYDLDNLDGRKVEINEEGITNFRYIFYTAIASSKLIVQNYEKIKNHNIYIKRNHF